MLYKTALFLHITGALMLFASIALEWLSIFQIRKALDFENIKQSIFYYLKLRTINLITILFILIPGIYMMSAVWKNAIWISVSFIAIIFMAVIGGTVTGRKMKNIKIILSNGKNISPMLKEILNDNMLMYSLKIRTVVFLGIVFLMTFKPSLTGSVTVFITSVILGFIPFAPRVHAGELMEAEQKSIIK